MTLPFLFVLMATAYAEAPAVSTCSASLANGKLELTLPDKPACTLTVRARHCPECQIPFVDAQLDASDCAGAEKGGRLVMANFPDTERVDVLLSGTKGQTQLQCTLDEVDTEAFSAPSVLTKPTNAKGDVFEYQGHGYAFLDEPPTLSQARATEQCEKMGATLLQLETAPELEAVVAAKVKHKTWRFIEAWIGGASCPGEEATNAGEFCWANRTAIDYPYDHAHWQRGGKNDPGPLYMLHDGRFMSSAGHWRPIGYGCEWNEMPKTIE